MASHRILWGIQQGATSTKPPDAAGRAGAPEIWEKMQEAVCLLERRDNPSAKGIDLKAIASDYELLEQIFISKRWRYDELGDKVYLDSDSFKGCDLAYLHRFSPTRILEQSALKVAEEIKAKTEKEEEDREFKEALSKIPEGFQYKDYLVEPLATNRFRLFAGLPPINSDRTIEQKVVESYPDEDLAYEIIGKGFEVSE